MAFFFGKFTCSRQSNVKFAFFFRRSIDCILDLVPAIGHTKCFCFCFNFKNSCNSQKSFGFKMDVYLGSFYGDTRKLTPMMKPTIAGTSFENLTRYLVCKICTNYNLKLNWHRWFAEGNSKNLKTVIECSCPPQNSHFTVTCLVAWPLNETEAGVDLVLIEMSLLFLCKFLLISMRTASLT